RLERRRGRRSPRRVARAVAARLGAARRPADGARRLRRRLRDRSVTRRVHATARRRLGDRPSPGPARPGDGLPGGRPAGAGAQRRPHRPLGRRAGTGPGRHGRHRGPRPRRRAAGGVDPRRHRRAGRYEGDQGTLAVAGVKRLWSPQWRWVTITSLWVAVGVLAQWGVAAVHPRISVWDRIYMTPNVFKQGISGDLAAQDWRIQLARFLGPLIFATTFFAAVATIFRDQIARARVRFARGHVVVAGLGD